ncbi:hypothetical protein [Sediminibacillus massiliensis]|uniref:hypothetical protein n=1 Tax=Sediminibacillus massiliensis TaxID=1926277 RepID=UPI0015C324C7|nr:hypothetical protein [Sediminibacillus massiliensis]
MGKQSIVILYRIGRFLETACIAGKLVGGDAVMKVVTITGEIYFTAIASGPARPLL